MSIDIIVLTTDLKTLMLIFNSYNPKITNKSVVLLVNGYEVELLLTNKKEHIIGFKPFEKESFDYIYIHNHKLKIIKLKDLLSFYKLIYLKEGKKKYLNRITLLNSILKGK